MSAYSSRIIPSLSILFNGNFPLSFLLYPFGGYHSGAKFDVSSQVPLITSLLHVVQNLIAISIKFGPGRIWIEWECL
jgi:hypothetical protein